MRAALPLPARRDLPPAGPACKLAATPFPCGVPDMLKGLSRFLSAVLVVAMLGATVPTPAMARLIGSEEALAATRTETPSAVQTEVGRAMLESWLAREEVRRELVTMGVNPAEVRARVAALGDDEVRALAGKIGSEPAGSGVIGAIVFVFLVLLVTDILGFTAVFSFTRPIR